MAIAVVIDATPQIAMEFAPGDTTRVAAFFGLLTLYLQLLLTIRTTSLIAGLPPGYVAGHWTEARYPSAFLLGLLTILGILAGLAMLILPGIALAALWSVALPALVAERLSATQAMRRSWRLVRPRFDRVLATLLLWWVPYGILLGSLALITYFTNLDAPPILAVLDLALSVLLLTGAVFWAIVFCAIRDVEARTEVTT